MSGYHSQTEGRRFNNQHHVGNVVLKQGSQPEQFSPFYFGGNNLGIVDSLAQHFDLIRQQLKPSVVSGHKKPRQKNENHVKHTRKTAHIRLHLIGRIPLPLKELRCGIRFRTPRNTEELIILPKEGGFCCPKAGFGAGKNRRKRFEMLLAL